jgi:hypothetical protein
VPVRARLAQALHTRLYQLAAPPAARVPFVPQVITRSAIFALPVTWARSLRRRPPPVPPAHLDTQTPPLRARRAVCALKGFTPRDLSARLARRV